MSLHHRRGKEDQGTQGLGDGPGSRKRVLAKGVRQLEIHTVAQVPRTVKALALPETESVGARS